MEHKVTQDDTGGEVILNLTARARKWLLTINNYTEEDLNTITQETKKAKAWVWQKEEGEEKKTPHIHLYIEYPNPKSFSTIKNIYPRANIEKVKYTEKAIAYCQKKHTRVEGPFFSENLKKTDIKTELLNIEYDNVVWRDWQEQVLEIIQGPINKRTINWIWSRDGNLGKSYLAKYIGLKFNCIIASGKTNDIFNQVLKWREENPTETQLIPVIVDVAKSEYSHVNYSALEQLKNGFLYSGKYEGGTFYSLSPHIVIFANSPPKTEEMSADRWNIIELNS